MRALTLIVILLSACAPFVNEQHDIQSNIATPSCIVSSDQGNGQATKLCTVTSSSDWEELSLRAEGRVSTRVLEALTREVHEAETRANFYPTFVKSGHEELPLIIEDGAGWRLDALLRSTADKGMCSFSRDTHQLLEEYGGDVDDTNKKTDPKDGNRCGNIAIIHSLVRLGVLSEDQAYRNGFLNPEIVRRIDQFHGESGGMTPDQQKRAYESFNTADREIGCATTLLANVEKDGRVPSAAGILRTLMESEDPKFDCSLALRGDRLEDGTAGFRHVEHVTGVRLDDSGEYLIDTLDSISQGSGVDGIPDNPASNTWGCGRNWIQLKHSTSHNVKRRYSELPPYQMEVRCCQVGSPNDSGNQ